MAKPWRERLRVYLMGEMCLVGPRGAIRAEDLARRQGRLAAAFLLSERARPVPRDELADVLWPESLPARPDAALNAIVSKLRAAFDVAGAGRDAVSAAGGCYKINLPPGSWVDAEAALDGVHRAEGALLVGRNADAYGPAVVAAAILRQPFLPGAEGAWIDARRDALRVAHVRALDCLAVVHEWNGEHALALRAANEAVAIEPYRESGYRRLMRLHEAAGDPAQAIRAYERLASVLARELGEEPGPETRSLAFEISARGKNSQKVLKN